MSLPREKWCGNETGTVLPSPRGEHLAAPVPASLLPCRPRLPAVATPRPGGVFGFHRILLFFRLDLWMATPFAA